MNQALTKSRHIVISVPMTQIPNDYLFTARLKNNFAVAVDNDFLRSESLLHNNDNDSEEILWEID